MAKENKPTMKAVRLHEFGNLDVLVYEDAPRPRPKAGQVLVPFTPPGWARGIRTFVEEHGRR